MILTDSNERRKFIGEDDFALILRYSLLLLFSSILPMSSSDPPWAIRAKIMPPVSAGLSAVFSFLRGLGPIPCYVWRGLFWGQVS
jgi:hypothetical protein